MTRLTLLFLSFCLSLLCSQVFAQDSNTQRLFDLYNQSSELKNTELELFSEIQSQKLTYIHFQYAERLDQVAISLQSLNLEFKFLEQDVLKNENNETLRLAYHFFLLKLQINLKADFLSTFDQSYMTARFFNEGAFDGSYPKEFYSLQLSSIKKDLIELDAIEKKINFESLDRLLTNEKREFGDELVKLASGIESPHKGDLRKMDKQTDSWLEKIGNRAGASFVNFLGQVMKKRKYSPSLRLASNFRENYLFEKHEEVIETLLSGGMLPGDIIIEKDLKANSDLIIPGYWIHASAYLGTIKDFKKMNLWDEPSFAHIRQNIEEYLVDEKKINFLKYDLKNRYEFEDIPWFVESDRPGVGVHPLSKFLQTDGMAVLRPMQNWSEEKIRQTILTFNSYIHMPYDYTHNVKNKNSVTCSKLILHVYQEITFPTSKNLRYISVSPDQIGSPVSSSPFKNNGQLQLLMFFDAYKKGELVYSYQWNDEEQKKGYESYLKTLPHGAFVQN